MLPEWFETRYVVRDNGCWEWVGTRRPQGYGRLKWDGVLREAHRVSYQHYVGPIPEGKVLDHFRFPQDGCIGPSCINPEHVRPTTRRENTLRSDDTLAAQQLAQEACSRGHAFTRVDRRGKRVCATCKNAGERAAYARRMELKWATQATS